MFDDPPITKRQVADFYGGIAEFVLPGLIDRPLMLLRCPNSSGRCFFQKHMTRLMPYARSSTRATDSGGLRARPEGAPWTRADEFTGVPLMGMHG